MNKDELNTKGTKKKTPTTKKTTTKNTASKKTSTVKKATKASTTKKTAKGATTTKKAAPKTTTKKAPTKTAKKESTVVKEVKVEKNEEGLNNKTKTIIIVVLVIALLGILFAVSEGNNEAFVKPETFTEEEQAELNSINVDDYLALKAGSDVSVIYIARPTCSHCITQTPRMKYIKYKYGVEINYLNTDEFDEEGTDYSKLVTSDTFFDEGFGTPTILIVQNDKIINSISGESEISNVVKVLKSYNLIK